MKIEKQVNPEPYKFKPYTIKISIDNEEEDKFFKQIVYLPLSLSNITNKKLKDFSLQVYNQFHK